MSSEDRVAIPPILMVTVEDSMDIMITRDTARRAASLLGFAPAFRAQLAGAAGELADLVLKTGRPHDIHFSGVRNGGRIGVEICCAAPWLQDVARSNVIVALRAKVGDLVDDIDLTHDSPPEIRLAMWLSPTRKVQFPDQPDQPDEDDTAADS
ncbi:MAG: hypothetical protein JW910_09500 [Anaerolineae bacterium]|nr:hypothetical protein [Anaerolineae bacterium]